MRYPPARVALVTACAPLLFACGSADSITLTPPDEGGEVDDGADGGGETPAFVLVEHPSPRRQAGFGSAVGVADVDLDGDADLLIGAAGQGLVYVAYREGPPHAPRFEVRDCLGPLGPKGVGWHPLGSTRFGGHLVVGELDGDEEVELLVGAPGRGDGHGAAFLFGVGGPLLGPPLLIPAPAPGEFGRAVALGDLDGDGSTDLVIAAPEAEVDDLTAGRVWIYPGPIDGPPQVGVELCNPWPVEDGDFGHQLSIDPGGSSHPTLHVAAPGNTNSAGFQGAGQVLSYAVPVEPDLFLIAEEAEGSEQDPPRFGMHIASGGGVLLVGAPRKDLGALPDAGLSFVFEGGLGSRSALRSPAPGAEDLLGYRVGVGNLVGDDAVDLLVAALQPRHLLLWDGSDRSAPPRVLQPPAGAGDHFVMGLVLADVLRGGHDDLVLGDPTWDRPGEDLHDDVGRVVVQGVPRPVEGAARGHE